MYYNREDDHKQQGKPSRDYRKAREQKRQQS
jgi:hypothetical protein